MRTTPRIVPARASPVSTSRLSTPNSAAIAPGPASSGMPSGEKATFPVAASATNSSLAVTMRNPVYATMMPPAICRDSSEIPNRLRRCSPTSAKPMSVHATTSTTVRIAAWRWGTLNPLVRAMNAGTLPTGLTMGKSTVKVSPTLTASVFMRGGATACCPTPRRQYRRGRGGNAAAELAASVGQALRHAVEEARPAALGPLVLLGRHVPALLEEHLCPAVAQVAEHDGHQLVGVLVRLIGHGEDEALRLDHPAVLALPPALAAVGAGEHGGPPGAAFPDVHGDRRDGGLGVGPAVPVGEPLGLGPLLPDPFARRVEHAGDRDAGLGCGAGRR